MSQNPDLKNQYEVHDAVIVQKNNKSAIALTQTPSTVKQLRGGDNAPSIAIILSELANYNTQFADDEKKSAREDQTQTPEFKCWFGKSKVVDADGNPLVAYRGTARRHIMSLRLGLPKYVVSCRKLHKPCRNASISSI